MPKSIRIKIKEWQLIRLFGWDNKEKIPGNIKEEYFRSQNKLKHLETHLKKVYLERRYLSSSKDPTVKERFKDELQRFSDKPALTKLSCTKDGKKYVIMREVGGDGKATLNIYEKRSKEERRSIRKELQKDFKIRARGVSDYALEEVAMIFAVDGVKIGHGKEMGYDNLAIYISNMYGEEYGLRKIDENSFRYLPPSAMGPVEPYGARKGEDQLLSTDDPVQTQEKVQRISVGRLEFIRETLVELKADPDGVTKGKINKAKIGALIHHLLIEPIRDAKMAIRIMEDQKERRLYTTMENCKIKNDETILYMGQSWGRLPDLIAKKAGSISVLASKERIDKYSSLPSEENGKITFKLLDKKWLTGEEKLPFPDCSFDVVFFSNLAHHQFPHDEEKQKAFLLDVFRLVKPGGKMVAIEPCLDSQLIEEPVRSYLRGRTFVVTDWPNKFRLLVRNGIVNELALWTGILPGASPHLFHSRAAAIAYLSGNTPEKSHFYNLGPLPSKEIEKVRELVEQLPLGNDGFRTIFDGIIMTSVRKPFSMESNETTST